MNIFKKYDEDHFAILRKISKKSTLSQRKMAKELGFSLGKLNYCIKELQKKGLIKIRNFKNNRKKINYLYILTPKGISSKTMLTINFMKRKIKEYDELKSEIASSEFNISNEVKSKTNNSKLKI
tara:strand:+ start:160 stop:531 length:372 start_codon:yes stop_codon:yes gene_type:complete